MNEYHNFVIRPSRKMRNFFRKIFSFGLNKLYKKFNKELEQRDLTKQKELFNSADLRSYFLLALLFLPTMLGRLAGYLIAYPITYLLTNLIYAFSNITKIPEICREIGKVYKKELEYHNWHVFNFTARMLKTFDIIALTLGVALFSHIGFDSIRVGNKYIEVPLPVRIVSVVLTIALVFLSTIISGALSPLVALAHGFYFCKRKLAEWQIGKMQVTLPQNEQGKNPKISYRELEQREARNNRRIQLSPMSVLNVDSQNTAREASTVSTDFSNFKPVYFLINSYHPDRYYDHLVDANSKIVVAGIECNKENQQGLLLLSYFSSYWIKDNAYTVDPAAINKHVADSQKFVEAAAITPMVFGSAFFKANINNNFRDSFVPLTQEISKMVTGIPQSFNAKRLNGKFFCAETQEKDVSNVSALSAELKA